MTLPPYGKMTETHMFAMRECAFVPSAWRGPEGSPKSADQQYQEFLQQTLEVIKENLWPEHTSSGWQGASARHMVELTRTDLDLMLTIQSDRLLDQSIYPSDPNVSKTHRELFLREDTGSESFGAHYGDYDPGALFALTDRMSKLGDVGLARTVANGPLTLKLKLQRPRAYQTAMIFGLTDFIYLEADTACTPSIFSGHCLQGALCLGSILEQLLNSGTPVTDRMLQYTADIGDRRVMAGAHYPSDNLASWLMVFLSAPFVFRNKNVRPLLWKALQEHSTVYKRIVDSGNSIYSPALQAVHDAYSGSLAICL